MGRMLQKTKTVVKKLHEIYFVFHEIYIPALAQKIIDHGDADHCSLELYYEKMAHIEENTLAKGVAGENSHCSRFLQRKPDRPRGGDRN
jgi:hypothetical protein